jgi:TrmH family RNA methyltransferase
VFIVEGAKMFEEAPKDWIKEIYVSETFLNKCSSNIKALLSGKSFEVLSDEVFKKVSDTQTPQGVLSVLTMPHYELEDYLDNGNQLFILLEDLQDPGNLGTIIRAGEGAGVSGIIMTQKTADIFNPKVIRSTMGSIYRVPFFTTNNICYLIKTLKNKGISVYAAHLDDSVDYDKADYTKPTAFLIGNEGNGLKRETADLATGYIKIPMAGQVESLNAAVATTILMYEAARQRRNI